MALLVKLSIVPTVRMSVYLGFDYRQAYEVHRGGEEGTSTYTIGPLPRTSPNVSLSKVQWAPSSYGRAYTARTAVLPGMASAWMDRRHAGTA